MKYEATVVVPVLNQRDSWLKQCVLSSLNQSAGVQTIIVTSPRTRQSTCRHLEALGHGGAALQVLPEQGNGFAAALNTGIRAACAERVGFLLSDDWLEARAVERCLGLDADVVSTGLRGYAGDGIGTLDSVSRTPSMEEFLHQPTLERKASYLQHFLLFKRRLLLEVGGVDEQVGLTGPDDFDLVWTLLEHGASVGIIPEQLYNYRDHTDERLTLRSPRAQIRDLCKILDKHHVHGEERATIIAWHSAAYGRPYRLTAERRRGLRPPGTPA